MSRQFNFYDSYRPKQRSDSRNPSSSKRHSYSVNNDPNNRFYRRNNAGYYNRGSNNLSQPAHQNRLDFAKLAREIFPENSAIYDIHQPEKFKKRFEELLKKMPLKFIPKSALHGYNTRVVKEPRYDEETRYRAYKFWRCDKSVADKPSLKRASNPNIHKAVPKPVEDKQPRKVACESAAKSVKRIEPIDNHTNTDGDLKEKNSQTSTDTQLYIDLTSDSEEGTILPSEQLDLSIFEDDEEEEVIFDGIPDVPLTWTLADPNLFSKSPIVGSSDPFLKTSDTQSHATDPNMPAQDTRLKRDRGNQSNADPSLTRKKQKTKDTSLSY